jgi:hypothetical protein
MTYKRGGTVQLEGRGAAKRGKEMTEQLGAIAQVPGGLEMLMTMAAEELGGPKSGKTKQLRLYNMGGEVKGYAQGGLGMIMSQQAEEVRQAGQGDDEMLLHLAPEEYEAITSMWGEPDINPNTGIPEYGFLSKLWKGIKKTVKKIVKSPLFSFIAPIALNIFAPGLGSAIGGWLGATGKAAATIGNTLLRTGIGAVSGGKTGAISGALSGLTMSGVGSDIGKKLGLKGATARIAGDALLGGAAGAGTGVGFKAGATGQAMQSLMRNPAQQMEKKITDIGKSMFAPGEGGSKIGLPPGTEGIVPDEFGYTGYGDVPGPIPSPQEGYYLGPGQSPAGPGTSVFGTALPEAVSDPSMWDKATGWMKEHPWLTAGAGIAGAGALGMFDSYDDQPPDMSGDLPPGFMDDLPNLSFDRQQIPLEDYSTYGQVGGAQQGEASFFSPNAIPTTSVGGGSGALPGLGGVGVGGGRGGIRPVEVGDQNSPQATELAAQGWTFRNGYMIPPGLMGLGSRMGAIAALGGLVQKYQTGGHVRGPGTGRSDDIPAVLSDGEYVIDSESVALLGDGSTDAGARRLDEMRENLRKHKSKKLAKGGFSDAARKPERYMQEGGYVPPDENPYKKGTARHSMWERKYGKKKKAEEKKEEKKEDDDDSIIKQAKRYKSRTERELEKLGEGLKKGGKVTSKKAFKELTALAKRLETAITTGNKKRIREINAQLDSKPIPIELARGGVVMSKRYMKRTG